MSYIVIGIILCYLVYKIFANSDKDSENQFSTENDKKESFEEDWLIDFWQETKFYPTWIQKDKRYVYPLVRSCDNISENGYDLHLMDGSIFSVVIIEPFDGNLIGIEIYYNKEIVTSFVARYFLDHEVHVDWFEIEYVRFTKEGEWKDKIRDFMEWHEKRNERNANSSVEALKEQMNKRLD